MAEIGLVGVANAAVTKVGGRQFAPSKSAAKEQNHLTETVIDRLRYALPILRLAPSAVIGALATILGMSVCCPARALVPVPVVSCTGDLPPDPTSLPQDNQIMVDLPSWVATELEMYIFTSGMMLGPRGWKCQTHTDLQGYYGTVSIVPPNENDHLYEIKEIFNTADVNPQAAAIVDEWAFAYFPDVMGKYTYYPIGGGSPITTDPLSAYGTDALKRSSPMVVTYTTPAHHPGIGDDIIFDTGMPADRAVSTPIRGFVKMIMDKGAAVHMDLFAIALPASLSDGVSYIQDQAETLN